MLSSVLVRRTLLLAVLALVVVSSAVVLAGGQAHTGYLSGLGDEDLYNVHLAPGETLVAIMRNDDCNDSFDPYLELHEAGDLTTIIAEDDDSADGCGDAYDSLLEYTSVTGGDYVLRATTYDTHYNYEYGTSEGHYRLTIGDASLTTGSPWFQPGDDRINIDAHAPVSVYCTEDNGVEVYSINAEGKGTLALTASAAEIAAAAPGAQIAAGGGATLYKLVDGTLQVSALQSDGKGYLFVWNGCPATWANSYIVTDGIATQTNTRGW